MKNIVVYTAISDGYDTLSRPLDLWIDSANFVSFLDKPQTVQGWEIRQLHQRFKDPCRNAKIHKVLSHEYFPDVEYSLWIDGSIQIISETPIGALIEQSLGECDLAVFKHRHRQCIYDEGAHCLMRGLDSPEIIEQQLLKYQMVEYPINYGLAECTVLLRRHTAKIKRFNEMWYREISTHSRRDQLSFNFVAYELGLKFANFPGTISNNTHFKWLTHKSARMMVS